MGAAEFLARLVSVNWVEKDHYERRAIAERWEQIWTELCLAIKDSVETFNRLYRKNAEQQVEYSLAGKSVTVSLLLPLFGLPGTDEMRQHARAIIEMTGSLESVYCVFQNIPDLGPLTVPLRAEGGYVFLEYDGKRLDSNNASELLLKKFLKQLEGA